MFILRDRYGGDDSRVSAEDRDTIHAGRILAETIRLSGGVLALLGAVSDCCEDIIATTAAMGRAGHGLGGRGGGSGGESGRGGEGVDDGLASGLVRDLDVLLRRLAASDMARSFLRAEALLADLDAVYSGGAVIVAESVAPRIKAVVDLARQEYSEVALRHHCPALLQYFDACKFEYRMPNVFADTDSRGVAERIMPTKHSIAHASDTHTNVDGVPRRASGKRISSGRMSSGRVGSGRVGPVNSSDGESRVDFLAHGREDQTEMALHRVSTFDLRRCAAFDTLSCTVQVSSISLSLSLSLSPSFYLSLYLYLFTPMHLSRSLSLCLYITHVHTRCIHILR